jgi:hypothetical protein
MNLYRITFDHIVRSAHDRPIVTGHITQTQRKIPFGAGSANVGVQAMQMTLREPHRLAADMVQALAQLP